MPSCSHSARTAAAADEHTSDASRRHVVGNDRRIAIPHQRGGKTIQFAAGQHQVRAPERADDLLASAAALALILEVKISMAWCGDVKRFVSAGEGC
jgi:hypothetical protein